MKKYDAIIFDLDGTLLNTLDDLTDSINYVLEKNLLPQKSRSEIRSYIGNGIEKLVERATGIVKSNTAFNKIFEEFKAYYTLNCNNKTKPFDGIIDMLKTLKEMGVLLSIVSNKNDEAVKRLSDTYFSNLISISVGVTVDIAPKPDPSLINEVIKKLNTNNAKILYVGDSDVDFYTSKNAGVDYLLVSWGYKDRPLLESLEVEIVDSPLDIIARVQM